MSDRHSYRGVLYVLLAAAALGCAGALAGGDMLQNPVLLDTAVALLLAAGVLLGISLAEPSRAPSSPQPAGTESSSTGPSIEAGREAADGAPVANGPTSDSKIARLRSWMAAAGARVQGWRRNLTATDIIRIGTGLTGLLAVLAVLRRDFPGVSPLPLVAGIGAALTLTAAGLSATVAGYLADLDPARFPEAPFLCRGARVLAWMLLLAAASIGLSFLGQATAIRFVHVLVLAVVTAMALGLVIADPQRAGTAEVFPLDFGVLSLLGSRTNVLGSILDGGERQLGIDLRSTWALTVVRSAVEPLVVMLCLVGWLTTSLTVVGVEEQGLVERLGVPVTGPPLEPGLHVHWPWPIDRVFRVPVQRVQLVHVGHEGEEAGGPEDVLWARQHAANEYTLLLGDGRDLITIDAAVQFRVVNIRAWHYGSQNPADALKAIAYRAVMRSTVNLTLSQALSQNIVTLTGQMRSMVQHDADALGLGVDVIGFTVGGMHPPVPVASAYQAVGAAELRKVTVVVNANTYRNLNLPNAEAEALKSQNSARADAAVAIARATGDASSFRVLEAEYRAARDDYTFRRRLEALERGLLGRRFVVIDTRFQRDGGELWMSP
jgi:membrane protease subunit HflK